MKQGTRLGSAGVAAIVFGVVSLLYFQFFRAPPMLADALDYFHTAWLLPDVEPTHRHLRVGLIWPLWVLQRVFGYSELAYYALPWVACGALGVSTWWLGRVLFSARVGWVAGLVVMLLPPYAAHLSLLLPDYLSAALFAFVVCFICLARNRREASAGGATILLLVAGLLLGWSYLVREFVILFFPAVGMILLVQRTPPRQLLAFCAGAILVYLLEFFWGLLLYGDPFIRLQSGEARQTALEFSTRAGEILAQFPTRFTSRTGGWLIAVPAVVGLLAMVAGLVRRHRSFTILALWGLYGWVLFTVIALLPVLVLDENTTLLRMHLFRYWSLILAPVFVAAAAGGFAIYDKARASRLPLLAVAAAIFVGMPLAGAGMGLKQLSSHPQFVRTKGGDYVEFRKFVARGGLAGKLWMDTGTTVSADKSLPMYMRSAAGHRTYWSGEVAYVNSGRSEWRDVSDIKGGYVVFDRSRSERIFNRATPDYFRAPESTWETVFRSSSGRILVLDPARRIAAVEATMRIAPASMVLRDSVETDKGVRVEVMGGQGLHVTVPEGRRAVLTDDVAKGLRAPPAGRNLVAPGMMRMGGVVTLEPRSQASAGLAVRCLFFDQAGELKAPWARLAHPVPEPASDRQAHAFHCDLPNGDFQVASARLLLQLSSGSDVLLQDVSYGFTHAQEDH